MKPVPFKQQNTVYAEGQPEYQPLPAYRDRYGEAVTCWQLTWWERLRLLFSGHLWLRIRVVDALAMRRRRGRFDFAAPVMALAAVVFWILLVMRVMS